MSPFGRYSLLKTRDLMVTYVTGKDVKSRNNDWKLLSKPGGPKPAWIYRDTSEILVSQFQVT